MKRLTTGVMAVIVALALGTMAYGASQGYRPGGTTQADVNALKQFQKETLPLRDEVQVKGLELRNEYVKENPDRARIAKLEGEIAELRAKIGTAADKYGLPAWGGPGAGMGYGRGYHMGGPAGGGHGWMMGGRGYNRGYGYCPMW